MDIYTAQEEAYKRGREDGGKLLWSTDDFRPSPGRYYVVRTVIGYNTDGSPLISEPLVYRHGMTLNKVCKWMPIPMGD